MAAARTGVGALALVLTLAAACTGPTPTAVPADGRAHVIDVIDGDTVVVDVAGRSERVRLIGIDTPETTDPRRPAECYGAEARAQLEALLPPGTVVTVSIDAEPRDRYGRLLAYLVRAADDLLVNLALVEGGFAEPLVIAPNTVHADVIAAAATRARAAGAGLWSACTADVPAAPR